jgi:hypothetical protein
MVVAVAEGIILTVLVVVLFLLGARVSGQSGVTSCQSRYISALSSALQARASIGDRATTAANAVQAAVAANAPGSPALRKAYRTYARAEAAAAAGRKAHPIPRAPDCKG